MLFFVVAIPGRFGEWCEAVTARLGTLAFGPTEVIRANTLAELSVSLIGTRAPHVVTCFQQPEGRVRAALIEAGHRFIVALDEPRAACADLVALHHDNLPDAVRTVSSSCGATMGYVSAAAALVLSRHQAAADPVAAAIAIGRHFGLRIEESDIAAGVRDLAFTGLDAGPSLVEEWWGGLSASARELVSGALAPYTEAWDGSNTLPITWGRDLFFIGEQRGQAASGTVDITGRARCLLNGPHIILPPGSWSLSLALQFSREATEHSFLVELLTERQLASTTILAERDGIKQVTLDFAVEEATNQPIALRVSTLRAAFDGSIAVIGATVLRSGGTTLGEAH